MSSREFKFGDGELQMVQIDRDGDTLRVTVGEQTFDFLPLGNSRFKVMQDGRASIIAAKENEGTYHIDIDSVLLEVTEPIEDPSSPGGAEAHGEKDKVYAPMPGKVVKLLVEVGQEVTERQPLVIVEAMKMENRVDSKAAGTVKAINFAAGDQVDTQTPIIELEVVEGE